MASLLRRAISVPLLLLAPSLAAQVLVGRVLDDKGRPIPGMRIQASSPAGVSPRTAETNAQGEYRFGDLPPGSYRLELRRAGWLWVQVRVALRPSPGYTFTPRGPEEDALLLQVPATLARPDGQPQVGRNP